MEDLNESTLLAAIMTVAAEARRTGTPIAAFPTRWLPRTEVEMAKKPMPKPKPGKPGKKGC